MNDAEKLETAGALLVQLRVVTELMELCEQRLTAIRTELNRTIGDAHELLSDKGSSPEATGQGGDDTSGIVPRSD